MICPDCKKEIGNVKFCPYCGSQVAIVPTPQVVQPQFVPKKKSNVKGCLIAFLIAIVLFVVLIVGITQLGGNLPTAKRSDIAKVMSLTEEQENKLSKVFDDCGILEIKDVKLFQAGETETSYHINDIETASYAGVDSTIVVWLDNESKDVRSIYFHDEDIYINGEVVAKVSDFYVPKKLREQYQVAAQKLVKETLSYPDTAEFEYGSFKWSFDVKDVYDACQSTVKAQNAFGGPNTMTFQIRFDRSSGKVVYMYVGDTVYVNDLK